MTGFQRPDRQRSLQLRRTVPRGLRDGAYLTIQFTGYRPAQIRGSQIGKEVLVVSRL